MHPLETVGEFCTCPQMMAGSIALLTGRNDRQVVSPSSDGGHTSKRMPLGLAAPGQRETDLVERLARPMPSLTDNDARSAGDPTFSPSGGRMLRPQRLATHPRCTGRVQTNRGLYRRFHSGASGPGTPRFHFLHSSHDDFIVHVVGCCG